MNNTVQTEGAGHADETKSEDRFAAWSKKYQDDKKRQMELEQVRLQRRLKFEEDEGKREEARGQRHSCVAITRATAVNTVAGNVGDEVGMDEIAVQLRRLHSLMFTIKDKLMNVPLERDGNRDTELDMAVDMTCLAVDLTDLLACKAENGHHHAVAGLHHSD